MGLRVRTGLAAAAVAAVAAGCTVGPDFQQPQPWWSPASWFHDAPGSLSTGALAGSLPTPEPVDPTWWRLFGDQLLTALVQRLAAENLDVRVATVRLAESRASLGIAQADQYPSLNGNGSYTREKQSKNGVLALFGGGGQSGATATPNAGTGNGGLGNTPTTGTPGAAANGLGGRQSGIPNSSGLSAPFNLYQYGFDASWELDFWGRVRRNVESAAAQQTESEESRRNTLLQAIAELARDYIQLRGTQQQIAITTENLNTDRQSLQLTQERAVGGLTTDLDVQNAAAEVASTQAQIPPLQAQQAQLINAISLLLGEPPQSLRATLETRKPIPPVPPRVPVGLPSELARRRPDIRQAEASLHAATADIGVAVADFYPRVTLSGSAALQTINAKSLADWSSGTYAFGPSLTLPIFEGRRLQRTLELRQSQQQEAAINYQRTVLQALHDVDNALTSYATEQQRQAQLRLAVTANQRAVSLARDRYVQGLTDFLTVLVAQRSLLAAQQQLTDSTTAISTDLVQLYKALGGGWEKDYPAEDAAVRQAAL
ncbi:MAG: efflux transporter outer membrane subunit [Acidisphaera sp.]|nr:efflux transporter outer membrane subunit [Acidisphaera sp.]MBV9813088.1 efflux transporter outer membrane subunit [Acetobacteraceae bacterium]